MSDFRKNSEVLRIVAQRAFSKHCLEAGKCVRCGKTVDCVDNYVKSQ